MDFQSFFFFNFSPWASITHRILAKVEKKSNRKYETSEQKQQQQPRSKKRIMLKYSASHTVCLSCYAQLRLRLSISCWCLCLLWFVCTFALPEIVCMLPLYVCDTFIKHRLIYAYKMQNICMFSLLLPLIFSPFFFSHRRRHSKPSHTHTDVECRMAFLLQSKHNRHSQYRKCWYASFSDIRPLCGGNSVFRLALFYGTVVKASQATHVRTHGVTSNLLVGLIPPPTSLSAHRHTHARWSESERDRPTKTDRAHRICQEKNTHRCGDNERASEQTNK